MLLFVDLSASSMLAECMEAEHFAEVIQRFRAICRDAVAQNLGQLVRIQGDGALAIFGHPSPAEDDARRACEAALAVRERFAALPPLRLRQGEHRLQVHSGVHAGLVLVSQGDVEIGRLELVGDAPNTAARLAAMAAAGEIYVDVESLGPAPLRPFAFDERKSLALPGKAVPVLVGRLTGRRDAAEPREPHGHRRTMPLIGRASMVDAACTALLDAFDQGRTQIVQILGEAGIGKSRVLGEVADRLTSAGALCLRGGCENYQRAEVLLPFAQMYTQLLAHAGRAPGEAPSSAAQLGPAMLELLAATAAQRPVLLIDDWHWADDASRRLLDTLIEKLSPLRVLIATRPMHDGIESLGTATRLELRPFTESQTQSSVALWAPGTDPFVALEIHQYAGGVPLLVEELCHHVSSFGAAEFRSLRTRGMRAGAPAWMASLVATRLARLTPRLQSLVRIAAVLGTAFARALLMRVAGDVPDEELDALARADFIFGTDGTTLRFKHGLTRDAVYDLIPLAERSAIHTRVVALLHAQPLGDGEVAALESLAYHAAAAGLWEEATHGCEAAGDKAMQVFALDRARAQYHAAIEAADRIGDTGDAATLRWCALVQKLGMTCIFDLLALPDVMPLFELGLQRARAVGEPLNTARAAYWLGYLSYGFGQPRKATSHLREALALAHAGNDTRLAAQIEATLGQALAAAGVYEESLRLMDLALASKRQGIRSGSAVAVGSAFTLACRASVLADRGDFSQAHAALDEARALVGRSLHPVSNSVCNWAMVILAWQGRWDEAEAEVEQSIRIAERTHALLPLAIARAVGGYARWMRDGSQPHLAQIEQAVHWIESRRGSFYTSIYYGWLVEALITQDRNDDVRRYAVRLLQRARAGERLGEAAGLRALALQAQRAGDAARAARCMLNADRSARMRQSRREDALNQACRAELLAMQGDVPASARAAQEACAALMRIDMPWHAARCGTSALLTANRHGR